MGRVPFTVALLSAALAAAAARWPPLTAKWALGAALTPVETARGLHRLTMSLNPELLGHVHLEATETWRADGDHAPEVEQDAVHFYRSVPIEIEQTEDQHPLSTRRVAGQQRLAQVLEGLIDRATDGPTPLLGRIFNLGGHIWTLDEFQTQYQWTGEQGPLAAGRPTLLLHFIPAPSVHPDSRMAKVLSHTAGVIEADAASGQVLGGSFHSLAPVKFGAGILADLSYFDGTFTMQPVITAAGECWVMRQAVVTVRARELFRHHNGTETINYRVVPAAVAAAAP